ncbi:hypothetical protein HPB48_011202 [Haemaphysalis longicornis]|uniref:Bicarbonate transporter-like transmembrane domain-containing protein n=1 Tax=Haemaphysalis longicornis TaxID=44386 RepID=A0A9J6FUY0_HAELO|nr:hypothetical protein HPB48_011202 [Haemaphysalis longicornis]
MWSIFYLAVIHDICEDFGFDFMAMYACVGLFNSLFLFLYVIFDVSKIMKWCTRSTEEIFSLFITVAFSVDAGRDVYKEFRLHYMAPECTDPSIVVAGSIPSTYNLSSNASTALTDAALGFAPCQRDSSLLFLLLMVGTVWLGVSLYNFNKTPYLQAYLRDLLADYALPVAVVVLSFVGSFVFSDVPAEQFQFVDDFSLNRARVELLPVYGILGALGLGFALSLLFFMDQNISAAMVNNPSNKLHKGTAYHLDLLVVGLLNAGLSLFGLPWMHGVLPHSPLHARSLADLEERVDQGHVQEVVVRSRETRLTGILSHVLIGLSLLMLPYPLSYIPTAVLDGLFLYMAVTSLIGNQMFERITLLFMEQAAYPPNHYIRRCPQRKIHTFTACQLVQLAVLCFFGFAPWPYVQMVFPVIILLLLPISSAVGIMVSEIQGQRCISCLSNALVGRREVGEFKQAHSHRRHIAVVGVRRQGCGCPHIQDAGRVQDYGLGETTKDDTAADWVLKSRPAMASFLRLTTSKQLPGGGDSSSSSPSMMLVEPACLLNSLRLLEVTASYACTEANCGITSRYGLK